MTNELTHTTHSDQKLHSFGARLQTAREALGIERKDAAAQLRLNEKVIAMLEKDNYPNDLPMIFIRGYMRSYGKFLQLPDYEIKDALEPIKPTIVIETPDVTIAKKRYQLTSSNYVMQFFTYAIALTMLGLVSAWWYNHTSPSSLKETEKAIGTPFNVDVPLETQKAASTPLVSSPVNTGADSQTIQIPFATSASQLAATRTEPSTVKSMQTGNRKQSDNEEDDYNETE